MSQTLRLAREPSNRFDTTPPNPKTATLIRYKSRNVETCDGTSTNDHATHVVFELFAEEQQSVARERLLRERRTENDKKRGKKLLLDDEGIGIVKFELSNQQVPSEDFAAKLQNEVGAGFRTSCLDSRSALSRIPATLGVSLLQMAWKMVDRALSKRTALETSSLGF